MFDLVFKNKKVVITGSTGFKGSWLCTWLTYLGAEVVGLSDELISNPSNYSASSVSDFILDYRIDICNSEKVKLLIEKVQPDFVFREGGILPAKSCAYNFCFSIFDFNGEFRKYILRLRRSCASGGLTPPAVWWRVPRPALLSDSCFARPPPLGQENFLWRSCTRLLQH